MQLHATSVEGVHVLELEPIADERGYFARTFDAALLREHGLEGGVVECSLSFNRRAGTVRGLHFQAEPHDEVKLVRVTRGAIFDVAVDLRPASPTYRRWFGVELDADSGRSLYIPRGCAHGFQTLRDETEVYYQMADPYVPGAGRGVRWDDPAFGIVWPAAPPGGRIISERDASYPDWGT